MHVRLRLAHGTCRDFNRELEPSLMPMFFFDLCNGDGWLADPEGTELADVSTAREEVVSLVRSLIASDIRESATVNLAHFVRVRDAADTEILRVYYRDTVHIHDTPAEV